VHLAACNVLTHAPCVELKVAAVRFCAVRSPYGLDFLIRLPSEVSVNVFSIRALTWGTAVAALLSALLLAGEDAGLPDLSPRSSSSQSVPGR
jgi:hypothetical protein